MAETPAISIGTPLGGGPPAPGQRRAAVGEPWLTTKALTHVLVVAGAVCGAIGFTVLVGFGGWEYYRAPLSTRGYLPQHAFLRPSGPVGLTLGIAGVVSMLCTLPYALRKRVKRLARLGSVHGWLGAHIFFGVVGPVLITLHTSFKFNGLVSVAYWMMVLVWTSGFVGRYLYVRIPKTIHGTELTRGDVEQRLASVREGMSGLPPGVAREIEAFERAATPRAGGAPDLLDLFFGELRVRARVAVMRRQLRRAGIDLRNLDLGIALAVERGSLARRLVHLQRARRLFDMWHVFHRPLVFGMFVIVTLHIGVALFFGYTSLLS